MYMEAAVRAVHALIVNANVGPSQTHSSQGFGMSGDGR